MAAKFALWPSRKERFSNGWQRVGHPLFICIAQKDFLESLWTDGLFIPSWGDEEFWKRALAQTCDKEAHQRDAPRFLALLNACTREKDRCTGQKIHDQLLERGLIEECTDDLVIMYAECGDLAMAQHLLDSHGSKDVRVWTALIAGYTRKGQGQDAISCFERMHHKGVYPDAVTFTCILKACGISGAVGKGEEIHEIISHQGLLTKNFLLGNSLVAMYAKFGFFEKAVKILEELPYYTASPWNAIISGFSQKGRDKEALECYKNMQRQGVLPDVVTYICLLKACGNMGAAQQGALIHDEIITRQLIGRHVVLDNALVSMYAKCGALAKARQVFEEIPVRDAVTWNALIVAYAQQGENELVLSFFDQMLCDGVLPSKVTLSCILKACGSLGAVERGENVHKQVSKQGMLANDVVLGTALVDMYAKCGALSKACHVFEELPLRDITTWNALIAGYVTQGEYEKALNYFERLQQENLSPNALTLSHALKSCSGIGAEDKGIKIHDLITKQGRDVGDIVLCTMLMEMYAKFGAHAKGRKVFEELSIKDHVSWSAFIVCCVENNQSEQALECFKKMKAEGLSPDAVTYVCILKACGSLKAVEKGATIHDMILEQELLGYNVVLGTAVLDMYVKCGALCKARQVFEQLPARNLVTWNALLSGYADHGNCEEAQAHYQKMQHQGISPDTVTYLCLLKAFSNVGAAVNGERVYDEIVDKACWENNIVLGTAVVNMYAKCGALQKARQVLNNLSGRDSISWNAMLTGYAKQDSSKNAIDCFEQMQQDGVFPDAATFSCMLMACGRLGQVEEAQTYFTDMSVRYGILPDLEHYTSMADIFGRAGFLRKAFQMMARIFLHDLDLWTVLLAACQKWGDANIGRFAFEHAIQRNPAVAASPILMIDKHGAAGMQACRKHQYLPFGNCSVEDGCVDLPQKGVG